MLRFISNLERRRQPLASRKVFYSRLTRNALLSAAVVAVSLVIGTVGYMYFEDMKVIDGFSNAAMILSGMGPLTPLVTSGGKIFASLYAIASGFLLLGLAGLILAPVFHRILHRFHLEESSDGGEGSDGADRTSRAPPRAPARKKKR